MLCEHGVGLQLSNKLKHVLLTNCGSSPQGVYIFINQINKNKNMETSYNKRRVEIVMLPTEDKTDIIENNSLDFIYHSSHKDYSHWRVGEASHLNYQHVHVTVSQDVEPIKEGDWYIHEGVSPNTGKYQTVNQCHKELWQQDLKWFIDGMYASDCRKIIATTDPKIYADYSTPGDTFVPELQQSFLKEFVANPDGEYVVEYDCNHDQMPYKVIDVLKLNQDNTVNITSVENNL